MDSMEKFENKELPKIEDFYSTLNEEHISEKEEHISEKCSTMDWILVTTSQALV